MRAAATASSLVFFRVFFVRAACIRRLADTVVKRSSLNSTGTSVRPDKLRTKSFTFSACCPMLPSIKRGRPAMTRPTWCCSMISIIVFISRFSSVRSIIVKGLARIPPGSLRATPILLSPISSPRLRVTVPLTNYLILLLSLLPFAELRPACLSACRLPGLTPPYLHHLPRSLQPPA